MKISLALSALIILFVWAPAQSQDVQPGPVLEPGYYIVVAAYRSQQIDFVKKYTDKLGKDGRSAKYGYDAIRNFYYVYLDYYTDFDQSIREMLKTRQSGGFADAWVRVMKVPAMKDKVNLLVEEKPSSTAPPLDHTASAKQTDVVVATEPAKEKTESSTVPFVKPANPPVEPIDNPKADPVYRPQILTTTPVFISLYNPTNNKVVEGDVEVVDTERAKLISKVKGNDYLLLPDPKSKSGQITLISTSFGYRKEQHDINYKSTEQDTLQPFIALVGNYYMIKFDMVRLHKGDIATLYNVYFYNDAAVMMPESKYELNSLLQMMKDNPNYRVRLHGHTNGSAHGKLITMGDSRNFFEITSDVKRGIGSARDLSRERAEVIREWLIANGIAADRMEVKAWGGSRMIHDKNSVHARKNVRVEVEVLQD